MKLVALTKSEDGKTKYVAHFALDNGKSKHVKFGVADSFSFVDGAPVKIRDAYRARHKGEGERPADSKGALSWWITWGDSQDITENIKTYKEHYNV